MWTWCGFLAAAALGACCRYLASLWIQRRVGGHHPWGTFAVNVGGCLVAGLMAGVALHQGLSADSVTVVVVGGIGSFTTFSTLAFESVRLLEEGETLVGLVNVVGSVVIGALAATAGVGVTTLW
ncbi:MAG: CrcB family protein [Acidimicrobiales bacterium]|nr:CrcB family protein [Acidimicrobiales bacterium]